LNETGVGNRFGPLHKTGFNTTTGWRKASMSQAPDTQKSANLINVEKYQATNDTLKEKLDQL
tara:strand:- start:390 stop:575 length:186 start_codon:yes stop_codon:yes gene_type:complete